MKYIIEHLEPKLYEWCLIEYKHISELIGKENLIITNVKNKSRLRNITKYAFKKSFFELGLRSICLLTLYARKTLTKEDSKKFNYLVLGGILGDNPPKKRTIKYFNRTKCEKRNLGSKQMSTDTAVYVADSIIKGKSINDFDFIDTIEIKLDNCLGVELPFRYVKLNGKILLPKGLIKFLKKRDNI